MTADDAPLPGQYAITRRDVEGPPEGFQRATAGGWTVVYDEGFTASPVVADDEPVGLVIGRALDVVHGGRPGEIHLSVDRPLDRAGSVERIQRRLVGRYVGLIEAETGPCLFADPGGALPVVYDDGGSVAASPLSLPTVAQDTHFRDTLFDVFDSQSGSWLPGTATYYRGVRRLLPNHVLDLESWEVDRFWPDDDWEGWARDGADDDVADQIVTDLTTVCDAAMEHYRRPTMGLTAGLDSRCLLALVREWATDGSLSLYTYESDEYRLDVHMARRIAADHGLDWTPVPTAEATRRQQEEFKKRSGYAVSTAAKAIHPTIRGLETDARIVGMGSEIGRGYYYRLSDSERTDIDGERLLERLNRPVHPEIAADLDDWLHELAGLDTYTTLDLAYQEHRLGCWSGPQYLGILEDCDVISPFCYRPVIELMHRTSPDFRRFDRLQGHIIDRRWSELNGYPVNAYAGLSRWRNLGDRLKRVRTGLSRPGDAWRYVRGTYFGR